MKKAVILSLVILMAGMTLVTANFKTATATGAELLQISELPVGSRVVDLSWDWEFRTQNNYSPGSGDYNGPVSWIIVAKDHSGFPSGSVSLLSEHVIALLPFDDCTDERSAFSDGIARGGNHWGASGTPNATVGIRPFLNEDFYSAFSPQFQAAVLTTNVPTATLYGMVEGEWQWDSWHDDNYSVYTTEDKVFVPDMAEVAGEASLRLEYFKDQPNSGRIATFPETESGQIWWTRQSYVDWSQDEERIYIVQAGGGIALVFPNTNRALRPMVNVSNSLLVKAIAGDEGLYEIVWPEISVAITDLDLDQAYFPGDEMAITISGLNPGEEVKAELYLWPIVLGAESFPLISGLEESEGIWYLRGIADGEGRFVVSGTVSRVEVLPMGHLRVRVITDQGSKELMPKNLLNSPMWFGLPFEFNGLVTNLNEIEDITSPEAVLTLTAPGLVTITFAPGISLHEFAEAVDLLGTDLVAISYEGEANHVRVYLDSANLGIYQHPATLEFHNIMALLGAEVDGDDSLDALEFVVLNNDGDDQANLADHIDFENIAYDSKTDTLFMPVFGFSTYIVGLSTNSGDTQDPTDPDQQDLGPPEQTMPETGSFISWLLLPGLLLAAGGALLVRRRKS